MFGSLLKNCLQFSLHRSLNPRQSESADGRLGVSALALQAPAGASVPGACAAVLVDANGRSRRLAAGGRIALHEGEIAWCVHPGPYSCELAPFAAAPEIGLRVNFAIDASDPRATYQRFDLFLASEGGAAVELDGFAAAMENTLQRELAQGNLDLPPCTTLEEWNVFRAGFNQLMYTRFGVIVDDCVPVDLGAARDYAQLLENRMTQQPLAPQQRDSAAPLGAQQVFVPACEDARALRRLFLELPSLMCAIRLAALPQEQEQFRQQQELMRRLDLVSLAVGTMPALELRAPNQPLAHEEQLRRARHSRRAASALDEAWAMLARLKTGGDAVLGVSFDEADRIVANLEYETAGRRSVAVLEEEEVAA